jgi:hypothetical protein
MVAIVTKPGFSGLKSVTVWAGAALGAPGCVTSLAGPETQCSTVITICLGRGGGSALLVALLELQAQILTTPLALTPPLLHDV